MTLEEKYQKLLHILSGCGSLAVAFSGGVDSSFLLKAAQEALGENVLALTVDSLFVPRSEVSEAIDFCQQHGIRQQRMVADVLALPNVAENPADRCYYCKKALFERMKAAALACGISILAEGTNLDDEGDYRPGMRAIRELSVRSPLREAGLCKAEIRELSRRMGLESWDKPSMACLASRIAYGETLTAEKLHAVEQAEMLLRSFGIRQCRVRVHGTLARIELQPQDFCLLLDEPLRRELVNKLKSFGFRYVSLDLEGFRSGSMNEILSAKNSHAD